jgi:hypothetical protein
MGLDRLEGRDGCLLVDELERRSTRVQRAAEVGGATPDDDEDEAAYEELLLDEEMPRGRAPTRRWRHPPPRPKVQPKLHIQYSFSGRNESSPTAGQLKTGVLYSLSGSAVPAGKQQKWTKGSKGYGVLNPVSSQPEWAACDYLGLP